MLPYGRTTIFGGYAYYSTLFKSIMKQAFADASIIAWLSNIFFYVIVSFIKNKQIYKYKNIINNNNKNIKNLKTMFSKNISSIITNKRVIFDWGWIWHTPPPLKSFAPHVSVYGYKKFSQIPIPKGTAKNKLIHHIVEHNILILEWTHF